MRGSTGILAAAVLLVGVFLALRAVLAPHPSLRNYEFAPDMAYSPARKSMTLSSVLPAGTTQQGLPDGVVIRGAEPFPYGAGKEEAARAGAELQNPFKPTDFGVLDRGAWAFATFCVHCHGADGMGTGPAVQRGMLPPPSLHGARARTIKDGEIFHIITMGQGNMVSHAAQVAREDRWKIILHIRALQAEAPK